MWKTQYAPIKVLLKPRPKKVALKPLLVSNLYTSFIFYTSGMLAASVVFLLSERSKTPTSGSDAVTRMMSCPDGSGDDDGRRTWSPKTRDDGGRVFWKRNASGQRT